MVKSIRNIEKSLGNGIKSPTEKELITRKSVRKSILASMEIKVDDYFSEENLVTKRPFNGILQYIGTITLVKNQKITT